MKANHPAIAPSMLYAYAAISEGVPFANGAPNLTVDIPGARGIRESEERAYRRKRFQDRANADEDGPRARLQGAHAGAEWLVFDEYSRQSRRRSARRSGVVQDEGRIEARRARIYFAAEGLSRAYGKFTTKCGSTTIRRAATTKKAGTTSTFSAGSAIRCRSRSISFAAIRFWRRRSFWTSRCFSTSRSARGCAGFRNG